MKNLVLVASCFLGLSAINAQASATLQFTDKPDVVCQEITISKAQILRHSVVHCTTGHDPRRFLFKDISKIQLTNSDDTLTEFGNTSSDLLYLRAELYTRDAIALAESKPDTQVCTANEAEVCTRDCTDSTIANYVDKGCYNDCSSFRCQ